jgi:microsomal dipeptidase-like Zn-dependent dipeptidase
VSRGRPSHIDAVVDHQKFADIPRAHGRSEADVENVMWRNWVRQFDRTLPAV